MAISSDVIRGYNDTMISHPMVMKSPDRSKRSPMKNILSRRPRSILRLHVWRKMAISHLFRIRTLQPANAVPTTRSLAKGVLTIRKNVRNGCLRRKL